MLVLFEDWAPWPQTRADAQPCAKAMIERISSSDVGSEGQLCGLVGIPPSCLRERFCVGLAGKGGATRTDFTLGMGATAVAGHAHALRSGSAWCRSSG
eukprot:scaffold3541_cov252-Pinguiococcus_pyrenoidosus.AAC.7